MRTRWFLLGLAVGLTVKVAVNIVAGAGAGLNERRAGSNGYERPVRPHQVIRPWEYDR